jgi:hypothetical protein
MFSKLDRAAMNQVENGMSVFPRYADWAELTRDYLSEARACLERGDEEGLSQILVATANSLGAFAAIQRMLTPQP